MRVWAIDNQTPYQAQGVFVRGRDGAEIWLVAVRATFTVSPAGECSLAAVQEPVALAPQHLGVAGRSSLRCDTDLLRHKPGTDVLINGSAHAPMGRAATSVVVSLAVGPVQKTLIVHGERRWNRGLYTLSPSSPEPFTTLPIMYERAFGGRPTAGASRDQAARSDANPLGLGLNPTDGAPVPNIEYPNSPVDASNAARAAGLGAIDCAWMPRRGLGGTYDDAWERERRPLVPADFSDDYFYAAPVDQRVPGHLHGGEVLELRNMTPSGALRIVLPRIGLGFRTALGGREVHHRGLLHTVLVEPDEQRLVLVWHTSLPCHHELHSLERTRIVEKVVLPHSAGREPARPGVE